MKIDYKSFTKEYKRPPKNQFPTGTCVYTAHQGMGKTLSMVHDIIDLKKKYPKCKIFSNIHFLNGLDYEYFCDNKSLKKALEYRNGSDGVIIVVDEAQLFFNKKDGISIDVFTAICQQRKDRRKMFFTCQIWEDLDISLRKQVKEIIKCRCILGRFQFNEKLKGHTLHYDKLKGEYIADHDEYLIYKHNKELYDCYDTYQKIITNSEYNGDRTRSTLDKRPIAISIAKK